MPLRTWIAAYNLPTRTWTTGGTRAEYPEPHYDVFEMSAINREHAERLGMHMRRQALSLTPRQRELLDALKEQAGPSREDALRRNLVVEPGRHATARQLAAKGLVLLRDRAGTGVRLLDIAYIPSLSNR